MSIFTNKKHQKLLFISLIIVIAVVAAYFLFHSSNYFNRRGIRQIRNYIQSFGIFSPMIVIFLVFLSTAIPPLPLPVPLIELVSGVVFGFIGGALIIWISQIVASVFAFYIAKFFRKKFFGMSIIKDKKWNFYREYLNKKGAFAIFLIRFAMAAPFNIISYLAGLTQISFLNFIFATALGTIPESLLYSFIGSQIRTLHIKIFYLSILVILIGSIGFIFTLVFMFLLKPQKLQKKELCRK